MSDRKRTPRLCLASLVPAVLLATAATALAMSIEPEPVKVTQHNSGPRYDIGDVERIRLLSGARQQEPTARPADDKPSVGGAGATVESENNDETVPIQRVAVRRIFLFPINNWSGSESNSDSNSDSEAAGGPRVVMLSRPADQREQEGGEREPMPSMFAKPFWPFMTPARPMAPRANDDAAAAERPHRPYLFGADEASRSPSGGRPHDQDQDKQASSPAERDQTPGAAGQQPQLLDPIQMMMDLMHQAISSQLARNFTPDLKPTTASGDNAPAEAASDERPQVPGGAELGRPAEGDSREDVVEIEGKKYLRKTVTKKHVGDNLVFVTRRLIFVPLNETESSGAADTATTTTTTTELPTTTAAAEEPAPVDRVGTNKPVASEPTTTEQAASSTTTTVTPAQPSSASSEPATEAATEAATELPSSSSSSPTERGLESADKAAERLVKAESADKPTPASTSEAPKTSEN